MVGLGAPNYLQRIVINSYLILDEISTGKIKLSSGLIVVVKKTFRYANVFFYNHLYHPSVFRNLFFKSIITQNGSIKGKGIDRYRTDKLDIRIQTPPV
jgi:hypothetical protein